ncbi:MAG: hypothetical protein HY084_02700 [Gemmatimonadetes bacterium]|nr:hypothetical protein [Gemmatimonadota bacterium]
MRRLAALFLLCAATAHAQAVIDPGMSKSQVIAKLGAPLAERTSATQTFLFYKNGVERRAGMNDVVILQGDKVVDAVFRAKGRSYSGQSSSPREVSAAAARSIGRQRQPEPPAALSPAPTPTPPVKKPAALPAERAQAEDVARPMPPAGSGQRNAQKAADDAAAAKKAAAAAAEKKAPDATKPDPNAPPAKKP